MGVKFKLHEPPGSRTKDLALRITAIDNGWVIKAGDKPFFVDNEEDLQKALHDLISEYVSQTDQHDDVPKPPNT